MGLSMLPSASRVGCRLAAHLPGGVEGYITTDLPLQFLSFTDCPKQCTLAAAQPAMHLQLARSCRLPPSGEPEPMVGDPHFTAPG